MFDKAGLFMYRALTGLHCGAAEGESGLDLPVVRERITRHPIIPGSSLKGVWRYYCAQAINDQANSGALSSPEVEAAFGPTPQDGEGDKKRPYAGSLGFTDARILFLPVRASLGTFALVSCPMQMDRYLESRKLAGLPSPQQGVWGPLNENELVAPEAIGKNGNSINSVFPPYIDQDGDQEIHLEDLKLVLKKDEVEESIFSSDYFDWLPPRLRKRLTLVSDQVFQWFSANCLEVSAHNVLIKNKVSENLWYEETVPAESLFFQLILESPTRKPDSEGDNNKQNKSIFKKMATTNIPYFQVGGHETKGRGLMEWKLEHNDNGESK